jgi:hypothetical protein
MLAGLGGYIYWSNSPGASKTVDLDEEHGIANPRASDQPLDHMTLLARGTREQLLDSLMASEDQKDGRIAFVNYQRHSRRAELAERLLEMELQQIDWFFAAQTYLESLRAADWINLK